MKTAEQVKRELSEDLKRIFDRSVPDPSKMTTEEIKTEIENCKQRIFQLIEKIDKNNKDLGI